MAHSGFGVWPQKSLSDLVGTHIGLHIHVRIPLCQAIGEEFSHCFEFSGMDAYHTSIETSLRGDSNAIGIVVQGSGEATVAAFFALTHRAYDPYALCALHVSVRIQCA